MVTSEVSKHMAAIGRKGGKNHRPGKDRMIELAKLSWQDESRAKRLRSIERAKVSKWVEINNNKSIA